MLPILPNTPPGSRVWRVVHFPLVLLVVGIGVQLLAQAAFIKLLGPVIDATAGMKGAALLPAVIAAGSCGLVYWVFVRFVERRPAVTEFGTRGWARELGAGLLAGVLLFSVAIGIIALLGGYRVIGTNPMSVVLPVLAIAIVSGVGEEILFRGLFFRLIETWLGSWAALILSAALFGALHLGNTHATLLAGAAIALEAGIMLAALYMLTRRLWAAIGLHSAWNFAQGGIYGVPISGFAADGVLRPRIAGPDLLTGGAFGAEASLPALIVCTTFGIVLLVIAHRSDRFVAPSWVRRREAQGAGLQE